MNRTKNDPVLATIDAEIRRYAYRIDRATARRRRGQSVSLKLDRENKATLDRLQVTRDTYVANL